jgi:hypothetical protein
MEAANGLPEGVAEGAICTYREHVFEALVMVLSITRQENEVTVWLDPIRWVRPPGYRLDPIEVSFRVGYYGYCWTLTPQVETP